MRTPRDLNLPKKFQTWRPGQGEVVEQIADSLEKVFLLDAPTGSGKSLIGIAVHQSRVMSSTGKAVLARLADKRPSDYNHRCIYVTRTKQLQDQILSEFPEAKSIKGRRNYPCLKRESDFPDDFTAEDCTNSEDNRCDYLAFARGIPGFRACPYYWDKNIAIRAPLAVLNISYFLTEVNAVGMFAGANILIIDEVDALESELMNQIQLKVTSRQLHRLGLPLPVDPHSLQGWLVWADALTVWKQATKLQGQLDKVHESEWTKVEIDLHQKVTRLRNFELKIKAFINDVDNTWLFSEESKNGTDVWLFKPVRVEAYAERYIWRHATRFLGMSGTILDPKIMAGDLGIEDWDYAQTNCPFPVSNRQVYYTPEVNLTSKSLELELPKLATAVADIIERYPDDKILVHTTSYGIRDYLQRHLNTGRIMTHNSQDREERLSNFKADLRPRVMLSPSFDRGVDLPDDLCRCIIICKVPYISLGDSQVKARMKMPGGQRWYLLKAAQTIIQMSGRGVRSDQDYCDTFILDRQFGGLMARMGQYFPKWWKEAIVRA